MLFSVADLYDAYVSGARAKKSTMEFPSGSDNAALAGGSASVATELQADSTLRFRRGFGIWAEDDDLDLLYEDRYNLPRKQATPSVGSLRIVHAATPATTVIAAGSTFTITSGDVTVEVSVDSGVTLDVGDTSVSADCTATSDGESSNVTEDGQWSAAGALVGAVIAHNDARFSGGADKEADEAYRARKDVWVISLSKGTREALRAGALGVPGVEYAGIDETYSGFMLGGITYVYVADASGAGNATLAANVLAALVDQFRAAGVLLAVKGADIEYITAVCVVEHVGVMEEALVSSAIVTEAGRLRPGQPWRTSSAIDKIFDSAPTKVEGVVFSVPATEKVEPAVKFNSLRIRPQDVTVTMARIPDGS